MEGKGAPKLLARKTTMVGGIGVVAGDCTGKGGRECSRVERAVILVSHFQFVLLEMEQRSGSSRERREREGRRRESSET